MIKLPTRFGLTSLTLALPLAYVVLSSNSSGMSGVSTSGCNSGSGCHGASSTATVLAVSGIPSTGWTPGMAYTLTATVTNTTKTAAGFDLSVSVGTISGAPANTSINSSNEIYHTAKQTMSAGTATWSFTWTAPSSGTTPLTINFAGNAVNNNGSSSGDAWNLFTQTYNAAAAVATAPSAATNAATSVGTTTATLNGTVNANNASTTVTFEYGPTTSYGSTVAASPATVTGNSATTVTAGISSLTPNTTYHYRVKAVNSAGTTNGTDGTFTTQAVTSAPLIIVNPVTNVSNTSAKLNASVNANGTSTTVTVQYGTTTSYGSTATVTPSTVTGNTATAVAATLTGLTKNTTYHYRFVAAGNGTTNSPDATFSTTNLGVQDASAGALTVYPNPASGTVRVELPQGLAKVSLNLFSLTGQRLQVPVQALGSGQYQIDIASLPAGNYWLVAQEGTFRAAATLKKN